MVNRFKIVMFSACLSIISNHCAYGYKSSLLTQTSKHFDQLFSLMQAEIDYAVDGLQINIEQEPSHIKLVFTLPVLADNKDANKIDLHANGKILEGSLKHDNYHLEFNIKDGRMLYANYQQIKQDSIDSDDAKSTRKSTVSSSQSILLPNYVDHLEKTEAKIDNDGKLILLLPNASALKNNLHRIQIK